MEAQREGDGEGERQKSLGCSRIFHLRRQSKQWMCFICWILYIGCAFFIARTCKWWQRRRRRQNGLKRSTVYIYLKYYTFSVRRDECVRCMCVQWWGKIEWRANDIRLCERKHNVKENSIVHSKESPSMGRDDSCGWSVLSTGIALATTENSWLMRSAFVVRRRRWIIECSKLKVFSDANRVKLPSELYDRPTQEHRTPAIGKSAQMFLHSTFAWSMFKCTCFVRQRRCRRRLHHCYSGWLAGCFRCTQIMFNQSLCKHSI